MRPLPPLPDWLKLEHQVAHILTEQENHGWYFDESLDGNLNLLSDESMKKLVRYYETGTLSLADHYLLLNEIIGPKAMSLVLHLPN